MWEGTWAEGIKDKKSRNTAKEWDGNCWESNNMHLKNSRGKMLTWKNIILKKKKPKYLWDGKINRVKDIPSCSRELADAL